MSHWNLNISDETDRKVRDYLSRRNAEQQDLAAFVDQAVRSEILRRTVHAIQERNSGLSADQAQALADEAVAWARADRS